MINKGKNDWKAVKENEKNGIAIYNFWTNNENCLSLDIGSSVYILKETEEWYMGYETDKNNLKGCFPKSFIHIIKYDGNDTVASLHRPVVMEIVSVLREWSICWKELYMENDPHFEEVKQSICELMAHKSQILSGTLPVDELKDVKQLVSSKIDKGNQMLHLDLVVRDDHGNILSPDSTSTIHLYRQHEIATTRLKKSNEPSSGATSFSHSLYVNVLNCIFRISEEAEILMTMFSTKEWKAMSENYLIQWRNGMVARDIDAGYLRVIFTDLASKDLSKEKVYLVCYVVRKGTMEMKENDRRASSQISRRTFSVDGLRRPFGVAALDISPILAGKSEFCDEKEYHLPFLPCGDKDFLDTSLRKLVSMKESALKDYKGQGVWVTIKLFHGDLKQVREENPHIVSGNMAVARKIGFPEIILPGDVRNDLYLTILYGEYPKGAKAVDKNVEVTVKVVDEGGDMVKGVISVAAGCEPVDEYKGVIYYHEDKPKWYETLKVAVSVEEFYNCHLMFTFKHRSSNETKDRNEKPFAIAHVRLMQKNGTTLQDAVHELIVFKVDYKKFDAKFLNFSELPCFRSEIVDKGYKCPINGLVVSSKDFFSIETCVCSTKLTQNIDLLGLLRWRSKKENLEESLRALMKVNGEEIVKFLQDTLDALFNVLMDNPSSTEYDYLVFEALIFIIGLLVSDFKFHHFQPVLELYISEGFSATLAYNKLITSLKECIREAENPQYQSTLIKALKCLKYIFKFIIRSRQLFSNMNEDKDKSAFELSLDELLDSCACMMYYESETTLSIQGLCLKHLPSAIPDLLEVYNGERLSKYLGKLISTLPPKRLLKQKMMTINELIHSELFLMPNCRMVFLPIVNKQIKDLLETQEEVNM